MSHDTPDNDASADDERWFDELYEQIDGPVSPADVDARITLAAADAVQPASRRWGLGLASAVVVVLSVGIFLGTDDAELTPQLSSPSAAQTRERTDSQQAERAEADAFVGEAAIAEPAPPPTPAPQSSAPTTSTSAPDFDATAPTSNELEAGAIELEDVLTTDVDDRERQHTDTQVEQTASAQPAQSQAQLRGPEIHEQAASQSGANQSQEDANERLASGSTSQSLAFKRSAQTPEQTSADLDGKPSEDADVAEDGTTPDTPDSDHKTAFEVEEIIVTGALRQDGAGLLGATNCKPTRLRLTRAIPAESGEYDREPGTANVERCRSVYRISDEANSCFEPLTVSRRAVSVAGGWIRWQDGTPIQCADGAWSTPASQPSEP